MVSALVLVSIVVGFRAWARFQLVRRWRDRSAPADVERLPPSSRLVKDTPAVAAEAVPPLPAAPEVQLPVVAVEAVALEPTDSSESRVELAVTRPSTPSTLAFDPIAHRGTRSSALEEQSREWRAAMLEAGERFSSAGVCAIVFVHGTFMGSDPLSAYRFVERTLPNSIGPYVAQTLRRKTRDYIEKVLGDLGNFGAAYVRLFEDALRPSGSRIPCTEFVWSSENHHVGRLEGALGLVRVLATHADLGGEKARRLLVVGHSHAGQIFALATQLLARSIATEAILDVARARGVDVTSLEANIETLVGSAKRPFGRPANVGIDFVTFGSPNRYTWANVPNVRALHLIAVPPRGSNAADGDWIRRLGVEGSDFPSLDGEDRRINAALSSSLGDARFAPAKVAMALRAGDELPSHGDVAFVEYGELGLLGSGLNHAAYTRVDAMLFHARLVAERFYSDGAATTAMSSSTETGEGALPAPETLVEGEPVGLPSRAWSALRALGRGESPTRKSRPTS